MKTEAAFALLAAGSVLASPTSLHARQQQSLDAFVASERDIAVQRILDNIGPRAAGAGRGVVIAAPGITNPDYRYSWTRDSALTASALDEEFFVGNASLQSTIQGYIYAEANRQTVYNAMGPLYPWGTGLGDPKFWPNLTRFNGVWGRPQRDGPAVRAIALMTYINYLVGNDEVQTARDVVWPVVINDLNYVAQYWGQVGYDLWEEVAGISFFTIQAQWRALVEGSQIAKMLGLTCANCDTEAPQIACFLANNFWNSTGNHIIANVQNTSTLARSNIDAATLLAPIENFDINGSCDNSQYQPCSSRVLATHKVFVDSFRSIYPINQGIAANAAVAAGRYPEDSYYGGNPWYLCTLSAAEVLYDAAAQFRRQGQLTIDATSLAFFQQIYPAAKVGTYTAPHGFNRGRGGLAWGQSAWGEQSWGCPSSYGSWRGSGSGNGRPAQAQSAFNDILLAMTNYADGFVKVIETYTPANGSLSEQFNRTSGQPLSAYDLTWSYASFVTMSQRRAGQFPASWNSTTGPAAAASSSCNTDGTPGSYAPAVAAGAPPVDTTSCTVQLHFYVNASTTFGQNVYVTGDVAPLGDWAPGYEPMFPPSYPIWEAIIDVSPDQTVNYKYVHQNAADYTLEAANRTVVVGPCGDGRRQVAVRDVFGPTGPVVTEGFCNPDVTRCEDTAYLSA
ncbi:hypothetical protein LTR50_005204 [Elasticomyces elasticus]|nr:hypothetical protein LTR50_005204 [Elasticomyces elasticus]